jgi:putative ABC transport system substrate-binding protein
MPVGRTNRRAFIAGFGSTATWPMVARAQQFAQLPTIGFLGTTRSSAWTPYTTSFVSGLNEAGFVEGRNVLIEYRWAEGRYDRLPRLAAATCTTCCALSSRTSLSANLLPARRI